MVTMISVRSVDPKHTLSAKALVDAAVWEQANAIGADIIDCWSFWPASLLMQKPWRRARPCASQTSLATCT